MHEVECFHVRPDGHVERALPALGNEDLLVLDVGA